MTGLQIIKIILFILVILLAAGFFVVGFIMGKDEKGNSKNKNFRLLIRIRLGCFLAMLIVILIMFFMA